MDVGTISTFFAVSAIAILALTTLAAATWLLAPHWDTAAEWRATIVASVSEQAIWLAWLMALVATLGSLYFSEVAHYEPCKFCWFQRIGMYPMALILGIAAFRKDTSIYRYAIPMTVIGGTISIYHYLIQHFPDLSAGSCSATAPCTAAWVWKFGFVSIPFMALACFAAIAALLLISRAYSSTTG